MWEAFGSRSECLKAPTKLVNRVRTIMIARHAVENEEAQKQKDKREAAEREAELKAM